MFDSPFTTRVLSFTLAIAVHIAVLFGGGLVSREAVTGTGGSGSIEVELTEGPPSSRDVAPAPVPPAPPPPVEQPVPEPTPEAHPNAVPADEMKLPDTNTASASPSETLQPQSANTNLYASSDQAALSSGATEVGTTNGGGNLHAGVTSGTGGSSGAAWGDPRYGTNPPPVYPLEARQRGQQGTVILSVLVNAQGTVDTLAVKESSSHVLLDLAAIRAVKRWHFRPASIAGMAVSSSVEVPIEFHLDQ